MAVELATRIAAVTVYRRGAEVRRVADLGPLGALPDRITLGGLPLSLEDASVRVKIEGATNGAVARDARVVLEVRAGDATPPPDEAALRAARREEARLSAAIVQLQREAERAGRLAIAPRPPSRKGEPPRASPTEARLALVELRRARTEALLDQVRRLEEDRRRAHEHRADLEDRWRRASSDRRPKRDELEKAVVVTLGGDGSPKDARLVLEYTVPGARWAPAYSLRIAKDGQRAELALRAVVCQKSGEDWTAVPVSLSTADAQRFTELPELQSLRIGRAQPAAPKRGWRPLPAGAEELFADYDRSFPSPPAGYGSTTISTVDDGRLAADEGDDRTMVGAIGAPMDAVTRLPASERARAKMPRRALAPAPMAAPQSAAFAAGPTGMAAAPELAKRSSGLLAGLFDPEAPLQRGEGRARDVGVLEEEALELGVRAEDRMLAYGDLRMPGADHPSRGRLIVASREELYLELTVSQKLQMSHEVLAVVDRELVDARSVADGPPPPRHHFPASQGGFDYAYRGDAPVDVPSDGHFHAIPLTSSDAPVSLRHVVVPRESQDVFRFAEIPNPLDAPLLDGPADVYLGDDYLLTTDLHVTPPRGKLRLGLGVDAAIKASRNTTFAEQATGLIGGSLALRHGIEVEIANHRKDVADVEVRERIPTAHERDDEIKVEVGEVEPSWAPYEQEEPLLRGGYAWRVKIEPGKRKRLRASYVVKIASKNELVGGNRRER